MIWNEIKVDGYDFCIQSGDWMVRQKGEQVELHYYNYRIGWCNDVEEGMFKAWILELKGRRRNG